MTQDSAYVATTKKKKGRKTERYMEKDGGEGAKPVWLEELREVAQVARKRAEWRNFARALCNTWCKKGQ